MFPVAVATEHDDGRMVKMKIVSCSRALLLLSTHPSIRHEESRTNKVVVKGVTKKNTKNRQQERRMDTGKRVVGRAKMRIAAAAVQSRMPRGFANDESDD